MASRPLRMAPSGNPSLNSNNIVHVDASGNLVASFSTGTTTPESASLRADGNVYFSGFDPSGNGIYLLDTSSGSTLLFASTPNPDLTKIAATAGIWVGDFFDGPSGSTIPATCCSVGYYGATRPRPTRLPRPMSGSRTSTTGICSGSTSSATSSSATFVPGARSGSIGLGRR